MIKGFLFDASRCVGCYACVIACKDHNDLHDDSENWRSVEKFEFGVYSEVSTLSLSISCMHCSVAVCAEACPVKAIRKTEEDLVTVDPKKCIGCKTCLTVCPFGAPQIAKGGKMHKCTFCLDPVTGVSEPACARACPFGALHAGPVEELQRISSKGAARKLAMTLGPGGKGIGWK
jgi:Fe-S-cluster-containing dehydrogenase component